MVGGVSSTFDTRELTIEVITSATTPIGCTTVIGAKPRLVSWQRMAIPYSAVPSSHHGLPSRRRVPAMTERRPLVVAAASSGAASVSSVRFASTLCTPRCWNWAPRARKRPPTRAMAIPAIGILPTIADAVNASTTGCT